MFPGLAKRENGLIIVANKLAKAYLGINISEDPFWNVKGNKISLYDYSIGWIFG